MFLMGTWRTGTLMPLSGMVSSCSCGWRDGAARSMGAGVEVAVESFAAGGQAQFAQAPDKAGEQRAAGFAACPVGVGGQVGGLGQGGQAEEERQAVVVGDPVDVVGAGDSGGGGEQQ